MDTGDAWPPQRGEHADIYAGEHRALEAVNTSTHPAAQREEDKPDSGKNSSHNDTTIDTTKGVKDEHNPLQNR